ncbi:T-cell-interacting, activating receptor on myeloid cells protein 1 isoform X2 [Marmota monax]|uniref:T-cell-interacting, activating receptor on myeloid cells protein 1 isoform X2 n=1 Tax=Marmota monax TaxID=9995 RepID=UPI0026EC19DF|nr:T-cell-interacting, activating receptor on myeloid cells protein 1 isoform X2 [Marmota monax]
MIPRLLSLLCFSSFAGLCVGQRDPPGDGSLPKPTLSAWPSSVVPAKSNVTLRCSSPVPGIRFILRKGPDILDSKLPLDPTKTRAEFLLTELGPRSAGPHTCECFWRGFSGVTSQLSNVLLLLVTGYLPKPSLQAHHVGEVTAGGEVTLQCQIPSTMVRPLESALLKAGTPSPVQLHRPVGSESDFSLQGVTVNDTGTYSCIYYQARAPFWASDPSPALDILVTVPPRASSEGYTKGNLVRLGVAAGVLLMGVVLVLEAWHASGVPQARPDDCHQAAVRKDPLFQQISATWCRATDCSHPVLHPPGFSEHQTYPGPSLVPPHGYRWQIRLPPDPQCTCESWTSWVSWSETVSCATGSPSSLNNGSLFLTPYLGQGQAWHPHQ